MALKTFNRLAIAYGNYVSAAGVTAVVTSGISVFEGGFPASNLEYGDPWTMMKTAGFSGPPIIEHQFASSISPTVLGIVNHNLYTAGYGAVTVEYWTGAVWSTIGSVTLPSVDSDILIPWDNVFSTTRMRFSIGSSAGNFFIGAVVYGVVNTFEVNPAAEGISQDRRVPMIVEQSAGGSRHVSFAASRRTSDMSISWSRGSIVDRSFFEQRNPTELLGVYSPEHGDAVATVANGSPIFWGYQESIRDAPRGPGMHLTGQPATYDFTVFLRGAS